MTSCRLDGKMEVQHVSRVDFNNRKWQKSMNALILVVFVFFFFLPATAQDNQSPVKPVYTEPIRLSYIFTVFFLMLGPFKIIHPFAKLTAAADNKLSRNIALRATLFSSVALLIASLLGESLLKKYDISLAILALTGGIILFLTALIAIIRQFQPINEESEAKETPTLKMALTPLAFPTIVTPYGIAMLIVFLELVPDSDRPVIFVMVFGILLLDLVFMLITRLISQKIFQLLAISLQVLASVLGIMQVALGLKIIYKALNVLLHS